MKKIFLGFCFALSLALAESSALDSKILDAAILDSGAESNSAESIKSAPFGLKQSSESASTHKTRTKPNHSQPIIENYTDTLGMGYIHSYMHNDFFSINAQGMSLQYTNASDIYRGVYQMNFAKTTQYGANQNEAVHLGIFGAFDFAFAQSARGGGLIGLEVGYGFGLPMVSQDFANADSGGSGAESSTTILRDSSQFDESSLLLNADIGYVARFGSVLLYPYARLEQYLFIPHKLSMQGANARTSHDPLDYGLNALIGVKLIQDNRVLDWWVNLALMSDFDASGSGVGVLADNSIVYDRDGMSNGALADFGLNLLNQRTFALQTRFALSYALSYYELNLKGGIFGVWQF